MKAKVLIVFAVFAFIIINLMISSTFEGNSNLTLASFENIARADGESGGTNTCYTNFSYKLGGNVLKCGNCCWYKNHSGIGGQGTCPDEPHPDC